MKVEDIKALQIRLNRELGLKPPLAVDGFMGPKTRAALDLLQRQPGAKLAAAGLPFDTFSDRWMVVAEREMGQAEMAGDAENPRIIEYHQSTSLKAKKDEVPWCSSFVNWVLETAGLPGTDSAAAKSWLGWGLPAGPVRGAITVIKSDPAKSGNATGSSSGFHVGFLTAIGDNWLELLGGNQSDQVKLSRFSKTKYELKGMRWPQ